MANLNNLNKTLYKKFGDQVAAREDSGRLVLYGKLESWRDVVRAGKIAANENPYFYLVNEIICTGDKAMPVRQPRIEDGALEWEEPDVLIIGGGIIGCAIARELSRYRLSILLVEKEHDLAMQASGRNNGIINSGVLLKKNSVKHRYNKLGNQMFDRICAELGVQFERCGQLFYFQNRLWEPFMLLSLLRRKMQGQKDVEIVSRDEIKRTAPSFGSSIGSALFYPNAGIVSPFDLTLAFAENAVENGVNISFDTIVQGMTVDDGVIIKVQTNRGTIMPRLVINAAGAFSETIAAVAGDRFFSLHQKKSTNLVVDKRYAPLLSNTPVFSIPKKRSNKKRHLRGSGVTRTIGGNLLIGPDVFETINKEDFSTLFPNVRDLIESQKRPCPKLEEKHIISYFSGIEAESYDEDFIVRKGRSTKNIIHAAGITFPGLTAAPAIAAEIVDISLEILSKGGTVDVNTDFNPKRTPPPRPADMDLEERSDFISNHPDYGIIVCRCEEVSRGEIVEALNRNVRCNTLDGVKRRVRAGKGFCQGTFCESQVLSLIAAQKRVALHHVKKGPSGSEVLFGNIKTFSAKKSDSPLWGKGEPTSFGDLITERRLRKIAEQGLGTVAEAIRKDGKD
ncbi:MAG: FAD-dependent oxidoreductase [Oscillospiraceae bacterium]|nr:FAD-dependent oxidoreductase [Oscillospiraceae bacterium]MCL2279055.1 FAD-dependent oxidoreductase [Oscillospiraceae bacterium]